MAKVPTKKRTSAGGGGDDLASSARSFRRILRALRLAAQDTQRSAGISAAQLFVLSALSDGAPASLAELADRTMTDRSSVSVVVDRLVASGYATRRMSAEDRRRAAVRITTSGRAAIARAPRSPMALLLGGLNALPTSRRRALARELEALIAAMGLADEPAAMMFEEAGAPRARRRRAAAR